MLYCCRPSRVIPILVAGLLYSYTAAAESVALPLHPVPFPETAAFVHSNNSSNNNNNCETFPFDLKGDNDEDAKNNTLVTQTSCVTVPDKAASANKTWISKPATVCLGFILAFNSGFINGCALSGAVHGGSKSSQAVSAVTASWTNSALSLGRGDLDRFRALTQIVLSYIFGSFLAGVVSPSTRAPFVVSRDSFGLPLALASVVTILAKTMFEFPSAQSAQSGFCLLAIANGITNSVTSTMTNNLCRTAHFSGISSDLGTILGQFVRGNSTNLSKLNVFLGLIASFWLGGFLSCTLAQEYGSTILFAPAALFILLGFSFETLSKIALGSSGYPKQE